MVCLEVSPVYLINFDENSHANTSLKSLEYWSTTMLLTSSVLILSTVLGHPCLQYFADQLSRQLPFLRVDAVCL
jgi:hypothetical protein